LAESAPGAGMGRKSHTSMSSIVKGKPQAKRLAELRHKEAERKAKLEAEVETWFKQYDFNQDGKLQRDELRALLTYLSPDRPPTEENLDFLIEKATAIDTYSMHLPGNKNGSVTWHNARATVHQYHEYTRDQNYLDSVFRRFDADLNGTLDATELPGLLEAVAPEGRKITPSDVHYIMQQCDDNGDGVISRDEVMPMLARWKHISLMDIPPPPSKLELRWNAVVSTAVNPAATKLRNLSRSALVKAQEVQHARAQGHARMWRAGAAVAAVGDGAGADEISGGPKSLLKLLAAAKATEEVKADSTGTVSPEPSSSSLNSHAPMTRGGSVPRLFSRGRSPSRKDLDRQPSQAILGRQSSRGGILGEPPTSPDAAPGGLSESSVPDATLMEDLTTISPGLVHGGAGGMPSPKSAWCAPSSGTTMVGSDGVHARDSLEQSSSSVQPVGKSSALCVIL